MLEKTMVHCSLRLRKQRHVVAMKVDLEDLYDLMMKVFNFFFHGGLK